MLFRFTTRLTQTVIVSTVRVVHVVRVGGVPPTGGVEKSLKDGRSV